MAGNVDITTDIPEMPKYKTEIKLVYPRDAEELLKLNFEDNRRLYKDRVDTYLTDIREGRWDSNAAEAISISDTGKMLNGQHRLNAIIKAGTPMWVEFRYGVPESSFNHFDCGKPRTSADFMPIKNATSVAALCSACIVMSLDDEIAFRSFNAKSSSNTIHTSRAHVVEYWKTFEEKYPGYLGEATALSRLQAVKDTGWNQTGIAIIAIALLVSDEEVYRDFKKAILNDADARKSVITFKKWVRNAGKAHIKNDKINGYGLRYWSWCAAARIVTAIKTGKDLAFKYKTIDDKSGNKKPDGDTHMPGFEPRMLRIEERYK